MGTVTLTIDGRQVTVEKGKTVLLVARFGGVKGFQDLPPVNGTVDLSALPAAPASLLYEK